jgi:serine/threonine-protein kinase
VLLLTTAAAVTGWYLTEGRFTSAPALASLSQAEATRVAEQAGLRLRVEDAYSETVPRGQIISTDPGPGTKVPDGGEMDAVVSRGPERYPMPSVVGLTRSAAATILSLAHLTTGKVTASWSDTAPVDTVLEASARAGARLKPQTAVDLTLSKGPRPVPVPDWTGKPADAAVRALKKAGFTVVQKSENSDTVPAGQVAAQTPSSGTGAKGDTVTVTRSLGPVLATVPNVRLMTVAAAQQVMGEAGFQTTVEGSPGRDLSLGFVVSTDPPARSQAPRGSTITLHVV